ncbi:MAG: 30S ribosomal protein S9 [Sandaracinaceae bacterium]|nr:MAG: 30S ribosomal protein S9 [Sandaracinaceae bacterium]HBQ12501.1 30S ribosomal protein S9 [Myxococcales bacterium]
MPQATIHGRPYGTGKRKNAIARVFLSPGEGTVTVNGRTFEDYFPREVLRMVVQQPFDLLEARGKFDVQATVTGGGVAAQAEAVRHGISRALLNVDAEHRGTLKKAGFLTRDSRKKERKKPGQPGARKKFQYSKR